jgi:hypothetical protein
VDRILRAGPHQASDSNILANFDSYWKRLLGISEGVAGRVLMEKEPLANNLATL